jgi:hypothetical protein
MPRAFWTEAEKRRLAELYSDRPTADVARALHRSVNAVNNQARKQSLAKSRERLHAVGIQKGSGIGREFRFPKGHVPANKGLRRPGYSHGRMGETQFKKGARTGKAATNWRPIGTILADTEGYLRIKVREATHGKEATGFGNTKVWPLLNRHVWEQHHGPIPPRHIVAFRDRDRSNCVIENLELIDQKENMRRNTIWAQLPRELALAIQMNSVLKRRIRSNQDGKEQDQRSA